MVIHIYGQANDAVTNADVNCGGDTYYVYGETTDSFE